MNSPLIIRHAVPTDADAISQLIHSVAGFCTVNPSGEGAEMFFSSISAQAIGSYITNADFLYLLGLFGDTLAGVVAVRDARHVFHLFVAPAFQYQGIGTALALTAIKSSLAAKPSETFTVNSSLPAVPFYARLGFQPQRPGIEENGVAFVPMQLATAHLIHPVPQPLVNLSSFCMSVQ
ncbi:GNAT family N-acetyltransferase [Methylomonas sp. MK1]|uniref:GNAT family N-acetyltransferase n=1 Tax=Methylomonas sp. MK1 TaxID=1131552 RepID=UPI00037B97B3|nr:GNAT family N-acetyltransferase [Methylomonas sp. MK1]